MRTAVDRARRSAPGILPVARLLVLQAGDARHAHVARFVSVPPLALQMVAVFQEVQGVANSLVSDSLDVPGEVLPSAPLAHGRPAVEAPDEGVVVHDGVPPVPLRTKRRTAPDRRE